MAENIANKCGVPIPIKGSYSVTGGQQFDTEGFNIIIRGDGNCPDRQSAMFLRSLGDEPMTMTSDANREVV